MSKPPRRPKKRLQLEVNFDSVVRSMGGELIREVLPSNARDLPKNADYLLFNRSVVAELKCLQKNYFGAEQVKLKMARLVDAWQRDGHLRPEHIIDGKFTTESLPERCQRQAIDIFAQPLDEAIKDANKQIKLTKEVLELPEAKGLLIVANDGNFSMLPEIAYKVLRDRFSKHFSQIQSFIYFAPGMEVTVQGIEVANRVWINAPARDHESQIDPALLTKITEAWAQFNACTRIATSSPADLIQRVGFAAVENASAIPASSS